jgi:drug/metabolite transporter (DMT)-like permease
MWPAALAATCGSALVGVMPMLALQLYAAGIGAPSMLFWRYGMALCLMAAVAAALRLDLKRAWRDGGWRIALVGASLGAAQTLCFWQSIKTLETSVAVLLFYTYPVVTLAIDRLVFKQPIRPVALVCVAVILFGAGLITAPGVQAGALDPRGLAWALPSPLFYSLYLAFNARLLRRHSPLIGAGFLYIGMGLTFGLAAALIGLDVPAGSATWLLLLLVAIGPSALTTTLFSYAVPRLGASSYAIIANVELVTVVAIGVLVLGESVTTGRFVGAALIVTGIVTYGVAKTRTPAGAASAPSRPSLRAGLPVRLAREGRGGG